MVYQSTNKVNRAKISAY